MSKVLSLFITALLGLVVIAAASPGLVKLFHAAVPLVLVIGTLAGVLRAVWFFTR
jgi:hypothetical protein